MVDEEISGVDSEEDAVETSVVVLGAAMEMISEVATEVEEETFVEVLNLSTLIVPLVTRVEFRELTLTKKESTNSMIKPIETQP